MTEYEYLMMKRASLEKKSDVSLMVPITGIPVPALPENKEEADAVNILNDISTNKGTIIGGLLGTALGGGLGYYGGKRLSSGVTDPASKKIGAGGSAGVGGYLGGLTGLGLGILYDKYMNEPSSLDERTASMTPEEKARLARVISRYVSRSGYGGNKFNTPAVRKFISENI